MKEIENYLPFYLGCRYKSLRADIPDGIIVGFSVDPEVGDCCFVDISFIDPDDNKEITIPTNCFDEIKPILRPLSDMTEEEKIRVYLWEFSNYKSGELVKNDSDKDFFIVKNENGMRCHVNLHHFSAETTRKLLEAGFDLFGLIESGLAISKTQTQEQ